MIYYHLPPLHVRCIQAIWQHWYVLAPYPWSVIEEQNTIHCVCVTIVASLQRRITAAITVVTIRITTRRGSFQRVVIHLTTLLEDVRRRCSIEEAWTIVFIFTRLKRTPPRRLKWVAPPDQWHTWIDEVYKEAYAPCRRWIWAVGGVPPPSIMGKFVWWYVRRSEILKVNSQNDEYLYMIDEAKHFFSTRGR